MPTDIYTNDLYEKWQSYWKEHKTFLFDEKDQKKPLYSIDSPPPFTSGSMSMGTVLYSLMDVIARYKKMRGFNVLFPQGWDMQGFPTEKAVEKQFGRNLPRDEFYQKCVDLSNQNAKKMKEQMRNLGFIFDDRYEYRTASPEYWAKVQLSLLIMLEKGFVYRERHPVEFCWNCGTAIAHAEINEREEKTRINYIKFGAPAKGKELLIATTRPELLHACVAIAVNPQDKRYAKIIGKKAKVPITGASVEIIGDDSVEMEFGTGAEMICTFGDKQDVEFSFKHQLKAIDAIDEKGRIINSGKFDGMGIKQAREEVLKLLDESGALEKRDELSHTVRVHDRCDTKIEFISSMQWFIRLREYTKKIREIASEVKWTPEFTRQRLYDWADGLDWDWAISRNRIFGTPLPFWYCEKCGEIVGADAKKLPVNPTKDNPPMGKCPKCGGKLIGESATCDVWIDSSITPLVIGGWPEKKDYKRFLPNTLRFQGTDIIRTWGFYTIFRIWALTGEKAWEDALVHGLILAPDGRMMHRSWGNVISPDEIIAKGYSSDALRLWAAIGGAIGKDRPFSYNDIDYAKSFLTKLYNTAKFVTAAIGKGKVSAKEPQKDLNVFDIWILNRLNSVIKEVTEAYESFAFYDAMGKATNFYWHEFADYYIENVKHRVYSEEKKMEKSKNAALFTLKYVLDSSLKLFAPVIPFTCEEVNQMFNKGSVFDGAFPEYKERKGKSDYVINGLIFSSSVVDADIEGTGALLNNIIAEVRKEKARNRLALNKEITSININVPEEYYNAVVASQDELKLILKARSIHVNKGKEFSASVGI
ncbi:MAG TPA: valine--tRNA ligase [Candidatus Acidoferrum sp.]|nr:valine--tRNA ligase [Candidatus Acidoferrum sp.]